MRTPLAVHAILGVLVLLAATSLDVWQAVPAQPGVDFYQFWGMAKAQREAQFRLGSPYRNPAGYQAQLVRMAAQSRDEALAAAVASRTAPDPTGTPFTYYLLGSWPGPYAQGLAWFRAAQFLAFVAAVFLLVRPLAAPVSAGFLAIAIACASDPLLLDLAVGNLNSLQLLALVVAATALGRAPGRALAGGLPPLLVLASLLKPIVLAAAGLLGLSLLARASPRGRLIAIAAAAGATGVLVLPPAFLFGDLGTWRDWWLATFSSDTRLAYEIAEGNYSGITLLARLGDGSIGGSMAVTAMALVVSLAGALLAGGRQWLAPGRWPRAAGRVLDDPLGAAALGILLLLALSPLVWSHYHVLAVLPALWLCGARPGAPWTRALGWCSLLLTVDLPRRLYLIWPDLPMMVLDASHAWGWGVAWLGMLGVLADRLRRAGEPVSPPSRSLPS